MPGIGLELEPLFPFTPPSVPTCIRPTWQCGLLAREIHLSCARENPSLALHGPLPWVMRSRCGTGTLAGRERRLAAQNLSAELQGILARGRDHLALLLESAERLSEGRAGQLLMGLGLPLSRGIVRRSRVPLCLWLAWAALHYAQAGSSASGANRMPMPSTSSGPVGISFPTGYASFLPLWSRILARMLPLPSGREKACPVETELSDASWVRIHRLQSLLYCKLLAVRGLHVFQLHVV